jgi:hypothetical protein
MVVTLRHGRSRRRVAPQPDRKAIMKSYLKPLPSRRARVPLSWIASVVATVLGVVALALAVR